MNQSGTPRNKKERKVSIVFRRTDEPQHCAGVEGLHLLEDGSLLTASRDSTIRRWNVRGPQPSCQTSYEGHADWVNDLAVCGDLLFSCSNDKTVRVWQASGACVSAMTHHSDYVTSLAAAKTRQCVASGGLRGEVFLVDIASGVAQRLRPKAQPPPQQPPTPPGGKQFAYGGSPPGGELNGSMVSKACTVQAGIYSLAVTGSGNILSAGSSDALIRIWDTRSQEKICKLRGHTENVRTLLIKDDCSTMLSGSADGTIRLWDLGMQRCVQTYVVHSDSVWSLEASPDWSVVYSGGRDKAVYRTRLATRATELLCCEQHAITSIAVDHQEGSIWVATPQATVHQWAMPREPGSPRATAHASSRRRASGVAASYARRSMPTGNAPQPLMAQPVLTIPGLPAIVSHKVLSDRRHVLTKDDRGDVALWDVLQGAEVDRYGQVDVEEQERKLFDARHCPSWFTADNRLGMLSISLEPPQCFNAEDYALNLGYQNAPDDIKVNYGKIVLECAFAKWKHKAVLQLQQQGSGPHSGSLVQSPMSVDHNGPIATRYSSDRTLDRTMERSGQSLDRTLDRSGSSIRHRELSPRASLQHQSSSGVATQGKQVVYYDQEWPAYWRGVYPAVSCQSASGAPWRTLINRFTGLEGEPEEVPSWVGDVVLRSAQVNAKESKCAFILVPAEGSGMPNLLQSRLNAPRILQVYKVATYLQQRLYDTKTYVVLRPLFMKRPAHMSVDPPESTNTIPENAPIYELELTCNGVAVPFEMSLSSVKKFIWCKSDDIVFNYGPANPERRAPMPQIQPRPS